MNAAASAPKIAVLQAGDTAKTDPYTIAILANPVLEAPWNAGVFQSDPIMDDPLAFDSAASLYFNALFGRLSGQAEQLLADPAIGPRIRVVRVFRFLIETVDANCLIGQDGVSTMLIARRDRFAPFLASAGLAADVAFATSASATHTRASAWYTSENDAGPGTAYTLDGVARVHRHYCLIPGTAALHTTSGSVVALHEFGHAASSYTNGAIGDQYVDSQASLNVKRGRPIPATYGEYDGTSHSSDAARDGLGYPAGWQSYHCELTDATVPSLMDDFWQIPAGRLPQHCPFDRVTRRFLHDRLLAKLNR